MSQYGIANKKGMIADAEAKALLELACQNGITSFDTAPAYGEAEARIGKWLAGTTQSGGQSIYLTTKLSKVDQNIPESSLHEVVAEGLEGSLERLGVEQISLVVAHSAVDLLKPQILDCLRRHQAEGRIARIGASLYDVETAHRLLDRDILSAIQIPFSVADRRFSTSGVVARAKEMGVTVFCRSVFLQGALLLAHENLPDHLQRLRKPVTLLNEMAMELDASPANLLLRVAAFDPEIDSVVVGVETADQLIDLTNATSQGPLGSDMVEELSVVFRGLPADILNPGRWPKTSGVHTAKPATSRPTHHA